MSKNLLPISAIIPTINRGKVLVRTLQSLLQQSMLPTEIIVIDATIPFRNSLMEQIIFPSAMVTIHQSSCEAGAAKQRNQGLKVARFPFILFIDDDILFEENCIERLWDCISQDDNIGGVNAMITNQKYETPGRITNFMYWLMHGKKMETYAGLCIGPAWNLLPEDRLELPIHVPVSWMNTTCTLYRRKSLPDPAFSHHFTGYSLMEDVALSLIVGKCWLLFNVRVARIFHDSQPGNHKSNVVERSRMELVNRHFVMTRVLKRESFLDYLRLVVYEIFQLITALFYLSNLKSFALILYGKALGFYSILKK